MTGPKELGEGVEPELRRRMKAALRASMRGQRLALPVSARAARANALAARLATLDALLGAKTVLGYSRIKGEVDPAPLLAMHPHLRVGLPRVEDETLTLHDASDPAQLETSMMGVPEPRADAPRLDPSEIDVVLVPALAVDPRGFRIGYGMGFYDRLLPTLTNATSIAIVYDFQLVAEVPDEPFDVAVHMVATDARVLRVR